MANSKSVYRTIREDELGISREKASEILRGITPERLEKIENGKVNVLPEDVTSMADGYGRPELCNHYCLHECAIGERYGREMKVQDLAHITVETLHALNQIEKEQSRLLEIVADEAVTPDEYDDFMVIRNNLEKIAAAADSLKVWMEKADLSKNQGK